MLTNKQKLEYALQLKRLHEIMVVKENLYFAQSNANHNRAVKNLETLQDRIIENRVKNHIDGNVDLINHKPIVDQVMNTALVNQRKGVSKTSNKKIDKLVDKNIKSYQEIMNNRLKLDAKTLDEKIERELQKKKYNNLSDNQLKHQLKEEFKGTTKKRINRIVGDALHTNQCNISFATAQEQGYKYKVWNNGRGKSRVRPWHRAKVISAVELDDKFYIYGSYPAYMMYPGDLNGGAENVANCRCWLSYTNITPSNLKTKGTIKIKDNVQLTKPNTVSTNKNTASNNKGLRTKVKESIFTKVKTVINKVKGVLSPIKTGINKVKNKFKKINKKLKNKNQKVSIFGKDKNYLNINSNKLYNSKYSRNNLLMKELNKSSDIDYVTQRGKNAKKSYFDEENTKFFKKLEYPDGTIIEFVKTNDGSIKLKSVTIDGKKFDMLNEKSYDFFKYQEEEINQLGDERLKQTEKYIDKYATEDGWDLSNNLRNGNNLNGFLGDNHEKFVEVIKTVTIKEDIISIRVQRKLYDNDSKNKIIASDLAHLSTSTGANIETLVETFIEKDTLFVEHADEYWKIINIIPKDSKSNALFMGNALNKVRVQGDWEYELNFPPNQKFKRLLIDEENKVIIQMPIN